MGIYTKTQGIELIAHKAITHPNTEVGPAQNVATKISASIFMFHASVQATENTNPGTFFIQVSAKDSGDEDWISIGEFTARKSTPDTEAMIATEPVTETALAVTSTTGFAALDPLYIQDASVETDGEWNYCHNVDTNAFINLWYGLTVQKDNSDIIWNDADMFVAPNIDLAGVGRIRVVFAHEGSVGADAHIKAIMVTGDSFGNP